MGQIIGERSRPTSSRGLVVALVSTTFLLWIGGSAMLPLLPSYLRTGGLSPGLIGLVMSSYYLASVLSQYPIGRLSDRIDRRVVIVAGLLVFSCGSVGFAASRGALFAIIFRALQGTGAGAVVVAAAGTIGASVPLAERGRAFGALYGSQMLAFAIGPLVGSIIGASSIRLLFLVGGGVSLVGIGPVVAFVSATNQASAVLPEPASILADRHRARLLARLIGSKSPSSGSGLVFRGAVIGAIGIFACGGLLGGIYEACWTLLLRSRHASPFEIGLSWTLYALPFAVLSLPAGRLAERLDRRVLAIGATVSSACFAAYYPFVHSVGVLIGLGSLEATAAVVGAPAAVLILSEATGVDSQATAQGAVESARTATIALGAGLSGVLFGIDVVLPFVLGSAIVLGALVWIARSWRHTPGRISGAEQPQSLPSAQPG